MTVATDLLPRAKSRTNITDTTHDGELMEMLDAAAAHYARHIGPLPGTSTVILSGGGSVHLLPRNVTAVTAATYADGTAIDLTTLDLDAATGLLYGSLYLGTRNVTLTVTVGPLAEDHAEAIALDVAGLYASTQRGGGGRQFGQYGDDVEAQGAYPMTTYPRIDKLRHPSVA